MMIVMMGVGLLGLSHAGADFNTGYLIGKVFLKREMFRYYVSILGMVGYSFLMEKKYGFITLVTYFLSLLVALSSYFIVGHG